MTRAAACIAVVLALLAGGCGGGDDGAKFPAVQAATPTTAVERPPVQVANGPVQQAVGPRPLAVDLRSPQVVDPGFKRLPRAGLLFDLDTGAVLWQRNPQRRLPIASVTKIMTALLVSEHLPPGAKVRISTLAVNATGSKVGLLPLHKRVGVSALLHGLLLSSGNDAAIALAQGVSGTTPAFVELMNAKASEMNLSCTRFASPSGLVDEGSWSCPIDLAALARAALDDPRVAPVVARRTAVVPAPVKGGKLYLTNHNPLLLGGYPGTLGIKTGYTDAAGRCLVAAVERDGRRLGVVLLHSIDPGRQARRLFDVGFRAIRRGEA